MKHTSNNSESSGTTKKTADTTTVGASAEALFLTLRSEAGEAIKKEPKPLLIYSLEKAGLLYSSNTQPAETFEEVISRVVAHRLSPSSGGSDGNICAQLLLEAIRDAFSSEELELGHTMSEAVREDALAVVERDPACDTLLEAVLFMKGFASLVVHRAARRAWKPSSGGSGDVGGESGARFVALLLQSQASSAFGVDIHPAAQIGAGVMFDHASGIVVGETAVIGDRTTILHGVTLGGKGKENGDRHPKVGKDVLIEAGAKILGNIHIGDGAKIGAGSVVLRAIPSGATAEGVPAKIIGAPPSRFLFEHVYGAARDSTTDRNSTGGFTAHATLPPVIADEIAEKPSFKPSFM